MELLQQAHQALVAAPINAMENSPAYAAALNVTHGLQAISNSHHMAPIHAMIRQGADELAQALPAFPDSNMRPQPEMGQLFEITPQAAYEQTSPEIELER